METKTATKYLEDRLRANPDSLVFSRLADYYLNDNEIDRAIETCGRGVRLTRTTPPAASCSVAAI